MYAQIFGKASAHMEIQRRNVQMLAWRMYFSKIVIIIIIIFFIYIPFIISANVKHLFQVSEQ
jgi:hypothetical protein